MGSAGLIVVGRNEVGHHGREHSAEQSSSLHGNKKQNVDKQLETGLNSVGLPPSQAFVASLSSEIAPMGPSLGHMSLVGEPLVWKSGHHELSPPTLALSALCNFVSSLFVESILAIVDCDCVTGIVLVRLKVYLFVTVQINTNHKARTSQALTKC